MLRNKDSIVYFNKQIEFSACWLARHEAVPASTAWRGTRAVSFWMARVAFGNFRYGRTNKNDVNV
jgi:hypothetical protein